MAIDQGPWVDVDLGAVQRNARAYGAAVGVRLLPMLKADGYGLGAVPVARALEALSPWGYGVATLAEARALRAAGVKRNLVAFVPFVADDLEEYLSLDVRPSIAGVAGLDAWMARTPRPFHLSIDTGMGRGGLRWYDPGELEAVRARAGNAPGFEGAYTHFHSADVAIEPTELQWSRFQAYLNAIGGRPPLVHAANSAAAQWGPRYAGTLARPGIFLYGGRSGSLVPEPVARLRARVVAVRPARAGETVSYGATYRLQADGELVTLGIGYADGVLRSLGNRGAVWLGGASHGIAGRVTMDMTQVVAPPGTARVGDHAILFGPELAIDAQADAAGTIAYELLTSLGSRVARRYEGVP